MTDRPRVLVADDDPGGGQLLIAVCKRLGFDCEIVTDGAEVLAKIRSEPYDVLLLDMMMPRVNGYEVIAALRDVPRRPAVIVLTAQMPKEMAGVEPGVVRAVIHKPFDLEALSAILIDTAHAKYAERTESDATS